MLTQVPADLYGLVNRGVIKEGAYADLVVLDENEIGSNPITIRNDLPLNAPRLFADASGINNVFCNGKEIVRNGEFTEARPGLVLRSGTDTRSPAMV